MMSLLATLGLKTTSDEEFVIDSSKVPSSRNSISPPSASNLMSPAALTKKLALAVTDKSPPVTRR